MKSKILFTLVPFLLVAAPIRADSIWHGNGTNTHFDVISSVDLPNGIGFEGETFYIANPIALTGSGEAITWSTFMSAIFRRAHQHCGKLAVSTKSFRAMLISKAPILRCD